MLVQEVARLDQQMTSMRADLESLRELQKEAQLRRIRQRKSERAKREKREKKAASVGDAPDLGEKEQSYASDSEYFTDYQSVLGTDGEMDSEEFYDVNTEEEEDDTLRESVRNGHVDPLDEDLSDNVHPPESPKKNST